MKYVVDSNVIVARFDPKDVHHQRCTPLVNHLLAGNLPSVGPVLILTEVASALRRRTQNQEFADKTYKDLWSHPYLVWVDVTEETAIGAADLAVQTGIRGADAIIAQVALIYNVPLVTLDADIKKRAPQALQILEPEAVKITGA